MNPELARKSKVNVFSRMNFREMFGNICVTIEEGKELIRPIFEFSVPSDTWQLTVMGFCSIGNAFFELLS